VEDHSCGVVGLLGGCVGGSILCWGFKTITINIHIDRMSKSKMEVIKEQNKIKKLILDEKLDHLFEVLFKFNEDNAINEFVNNIKYMQHKESDETKKEFYNIIKNTYNSVKLIYDAPFESYCIDTEMGWDFHLFTFNMTKSFIIPKEVVDAMRALNLKSIKTKYTQIDIDNNTNEDKWGFMYQIDNSKNDIYNNIYGCIVPKLDDEYNNVIKKMNLLKKKVEKQDEKERVDKRDPLPYNKFVLLIKEFNSDCFTFEDIKKIFWDSHRINVLKVD